MQTGIALKRGGKYQEALKNYLIAGECIDSGEISGEDILNFYKSMGKITYILGDYQASCINYLNYIKILHVIAKHMNQVISTAQDLVNIDANIVTHLGYSVLQLVPDIYTESNRDSILDEYRKSIDPYYEKQFDSKSNITFEADRIALNIGANFARLQLPDILQA